MKNLHSNQKKVLEYLISNPKGVTLEELSKILEISKSAAKEHVLKVEAFGLIYFKDIPGSIGRPKRKYFLTKDGQEVFPRQYSWLSNSLLEHLSNNLEPGAMEKILRSLAKEVADSFSDRLRKAESTKDRLTIINEIMNELGYRSRIKQRDMRKGAIIEAMNCVYHRVAKTHPNLCQFDIQFIKSASQRENVTLEKCISRGDSVCRFCIK